MMSYLLPSRLKMIEVAVDRVLWVVGGDIYMIVVYGGWSRPQKGSGIWFFEL